MQWVKHGLCHSANCVILGNPFILSEILFVKCCTTLNMLVRILDNEELTSIGDIKKIILVSFVAKYYKRLYILFTLWNFVVDTNPARRC